MPRSYLTHASSNGVPFVEQVLCARRSTSICLVLNADPDPRKSVLLIYRRGSERRPRQVKLFEQENRNSTKCPSSIWWVRDAAPPLSLFPLPKKDWSGVKTGEEQKLGEGSLKPDMRLELQTA